LSSAGKWSVEDGPFNYEDFFNTIVELFDDLEDDWVKETLEFWNK